MVTRKFKTLSKRTVRGSALVTFSDTKIRLHCAERKAKVYGDWGYETFVNFVRVHCICLCNTILTLSPRHDFFL